MSDLRSHFLLRIGMRRTAKAIRSAPNVPCAGFTLVELLVAVTVALVVLSSVVATFIAILRVSAESQVLLTATANARAALQTLSDEVKQATNVVGLADFVGENNPLASGDGIDNDNDGQVDEELANGIDDDGDWDMIAIPPATASTLTERPEYISRADWGDAGVDEDNRFGLDNLRMRLVPLAETDYAYRDVVYQVDSFEGEDRVLVRTETCFDALGDVLSTNTAPLAYQVLSFNCLYWNPNAQPEDQYWQETWSSSDPQPAPGFFIPAAVMVDLIVYADAKPIENYQDGMAVETVRVPTIVNIEGIVQDVAYPRNP